MLKTEQNLIVHSDKSECEVTSNRILRMTYCTIEAGYRQTRSIEQPLCDSRTACCICRRGGGYVTVLSFCYSFRHSVMLLAG